MVRGAERVIPLGELRFLCVSRRVEKPPVIEGHVTQMCHSPTDFAALTRKCFANAREVDAV